MEDRLDSMVGSAEFEASVDVRPFLLPFFFDDDDFLLEEDFGMTLRAGNEQEPILKKGEPASKGFARVS